MSFTRRFTYQEVSAGLTSRSQAKRLIKALPSKGKIVIDFTGVSRIQQGYADELFRVWPLAKADVELGTLNANDDVVRIISHVRGRKDLPQPRSAIAING